MFQKYFLYALVMLIVLQSVDAMADAVKFHQPNSPYTEADYFPNNSHADLTNIQIDSKQSPQDSTKKINDHCCYCHGISNASLTENNYHFYAINIKDELISYQKTYRQEIISPDRKPPISRS